MSNPDPEKRFGPMPLNSSCYSRNRPSIWDYRCCLVTHSLVAWPAGAAKRITKSWHVWTSGGESGWFLGVKADVDSGRVKTEIAEKAANCHHALCIDHPRPQTIYMTSRVRCKHSSSHRRRDSCRHKQLQKIQYSLGICRGLFLRCPAPK
jgi:hypothetical protein